LTKSGHILAAAAAAGILLSCGGGAFAQNAPPPFPVPPPANAPLPFVSPIFGDNMVLQRGKPDSIWGWSKPGDTVRVQIGERSATGTAGPDHRWEVKIEPPAPGGPYTVTISGAQNVELHNVLVGDVWICGGQSNMGLPLRFTADGGLVVKGDKLGEFSVAGDDRKWYWADARIKGRTVIVSSPSVPHPAQVRYAWQSNPEATLFNGAGLPAAPFRTDDWPGMTPNARPY
jgi:hypothetical protein